ncbi:MAG TPA: hypothetical protein VNA19_00710 [Pyrinomonadaceae bacterium]|jgi:hypothetical protein|nr:hypothetical protein [Pyrinomonadaceae bacterium]
MKRRISSRQTFFKKFIYPVLWMVWVMLVISTKGADAFSQWGYVLLGTILSIYIYRHIIRLKAVSVDDDFLYVSDYLREISVPLSEIGDVTQGSWPNNQLIKIRLNSPSEFGTEIAFMPTVRFFNFGSHPVVDELRELVAEKKAQARYVRQSPVRQSLT